MASTTQGPAINNPDVPITRKRFVPLENNPDVMNTLVYDLGLSKALAFQDVFSIDDPDLLAFVPRPALALLLIFPVSEVYEKSRHDEDQDRTEYSGSGPDEPAIWYKQTIGNACGLIGLLHAVSNGPARASIQPDSKLDKLLRDAIPLKPAERADLLYESQALESAHQAAASEGDTSAPSADDRVDLHFVTFVKTEDNHLYELDGRRKGPLDRGVLEPEEDVLSEKALQIGPRTFMKREADNGGQDLRFSLIALVSSMD
ncbi:cysteine proteinase [Microthyrium microscopicum]|uniref:Ubiquitin carboxyl-terminal hydrolase n=1 Tax=Microthyrium microscopicum TaxID=703497 RepID=A0A6A6UI63_9PEZI|nr:cysteine proteinase [Microthyrium microscopicum]